MLSRNKAFRLATKVMGLGTANHRVELKHCSATLIQNLFITSAPGHLYLVKKFFSIVVDHLPLKSCPDDVQWLASYKPTYLPPAYSVGDSQCLFGFTLAYT